MGFLAAVGVLAVSMNSCCFRFSPKANVAMEAGDGESGGQHAGAQLRGLGGVSAGVLASDKSQGWIYLGP